MMDEGKRLIEVWGRRDMNGGGGGCLVVMIVVDDMIFHGSMRDCLLG